MKLHSVILLSFWSDLLTCTWPFANGGRAVRCWRAFGKHSRYFSCISKMVSCISSADCPFRKSFRPTWNMISVIFPGLWISGMLCSASFAVHLLNFFTCVPGFNWCRFSLSPFESDMSKICSLSSPTLLLLFLLLLLLLLLTSMSSSSSLS